MDHPITVKYLLIALGLYLAYIVLMDHFAVNEIMNFMSQIKVV